MSKRFITHLLPLLLALLAASSAHGQGSAFTYQGRLTTGGNPAAGLYEMQFRLFDTPDVGTGTQQGNTITNNAVQVTNGVFTVQLDFGATVFDGSPRFLEIGVRTAGNPNPFTILAPRQAITATPYALMSLTAASADGLSVACVNCVTSSQIGSVNASVLTGTLPVASIPAGSGNYIQNTTTQQASSNFNISGNGVVGGLLGIGTTTLAARLAVRGDGIDVLLGSAGCGAPTAAIGFGTMSGCTDFALGANVNAGASAGTFINRPTGRSIHFRENNGPDQMTIAPGGNVGIGTSDPVNGKLEVQGNFQGGIFTATNPNVGNGVVGRALTTSVNGVGVVGSAAGAGKGVVGNSVSGKGVDGFSDTGIGVFGQSATGVGVYGQSTNGNDGVVGESRVANRSGVYGFTTHADGCGGCFENRAGGLALGVTGIGRVSILQITGGSDLAEHFEVAEGVKPGMVVAIDPQHAGKLSMARGAYNRRAAGVISGAKNLTAGMVLPDLAGAKKSMPVALSGRVWVYCDATRNPIQPGDLLTTSFTPGHAMKVTNHAKAQGAIIGKAMTGLKSGRGLVLVLVTLQ